MKDDNRKSPIRTVVLVGIGVIALGITVASTFVQVTKRSAPATATSVWPFSGQAWSRAAAQQIERTQDRAARRAAARDALRAISISPLDPRAIRVLGTVALLDGDGAQGIALLKLSESFSRREVPTQLALIEEAVGRGDINGALIHYDRAMRTSMSSREILFPILISAGQSPKIAARLGDMLSRDPQWAADFIPRYIGASTNAEALAIVAIRSGLTRLARSDPRRQSLIDRLVALNVYPLALKLSGPGAVAKAPVNGSFDLLVTTPPFDWVVNDKGPVTGYIERTGDSGVLRLVGDGTAGIGARQLLRLLPGRYRLSFTASAPSAANVSATLSCAKGGNQLARISLQSQTNQGTVSGEFTSPQGCEWLWIGLGLGADLDSTRTEATLDDVRIVRLP